jgi:hypothetical protein
MFFGAGNPIIGYKHRNVQRAMLGGVWGAFAVTSPTATSSVTKTFTYTVPVSYNIDKIKLVGAVMKYGSTVADREIVNAIESPYITGCPPAKVVPICVVTRDSATNKNMVVWEKTGVTYAKNYKIYRETTSPGTYSLIATQAANLFSTYIDMSSNPNIASNRYKLVMEDSCGNEVPVTDTSVHHHRTVLITSTVSGSSVILNWNLYEGRGFTSAIVMQSIGSGPFTPLITLPPSTTTYTITTPPSGTVAYRLDIVVPGGCSPSKTTGLNVISSNIVFPFGASDITSVNGVESTCKAYPNPVENNITLEGTFKGDHIVLFDAVGRKVQSWEISTTATKQNLTLVPMENGLYILTVVNAETGKRTSIILQKQ